MTAKKWDEHDRALLAGLISGRVPLETIESVSRDDFAVDDFGLAFQAILDIAKSGVPLVQSSIVAELRARSYCGASPISPSISALGTSAATESMTIRSTPPERTRESAI